MTSDTSNATEEALEDLKSQGKLPEAVLKDLVKIYDEISLMSVKEVMDMLKRFHLDTQGTESALRDNLKSSYKKVLLAGKDLALSSELLPYYIVVDFEATCTETGSSSYRHEIIEFPAVLVNSRQQEIVDTFQMYCKPQINPTLSKFCTDLTGITQETVDSAETFDKVLAHFHKWMSKHHLHMNNCAIVTDGPWDMSRFLYSQCHYSNVQFPKWASKWFNLRKAFSKFYKCERICLKSMLEFLGMDFVGRPHCGLDDARNIARILLKMIYDGANVQVNERITGLKKRKGKVKGQRSSVTNDDGEDGEKMQTVRVEAHYKPIYNENIPVYKRTRRLRLIAEVQLARKILKSPNSPEETEAGTGSKPATTKKKPAIRC